MKKNIFAVCDLEASYACNLTEYMNERHKTPFEVQPFTNIQSLKEYALEHPIELLLISTSAMCDEIRALDIKRIIILSEGEKLSGLEPYDQTERNSDYRVYKYQSSEQLVAEVMNCYAKTQPYIQPEVLNTERTEIIGVFSPLGRVGKTMFSLTLGEELAETRKVLYLNLEDYSGFETMFGREYRWDISDLVYFARQKEGNLSYKINGVIQTFHKLDYIPPAFSPLDLKEVHYEEWLLLLKEIAGYEEYDCIILDMGNLMDELHQILKQCSRIYMPVLEDTFSKAKIRQFEKNLEALECGEVLTRIKKVHLPAVNLPTEGTDFIEQLHWGTMGNYVRKLLAEERNG